MKLTLENIEKQVGAQTHLYAMSLELVPQAVTVLLGATQAGKTSLMRVMAGLDAPSAGRVTVDGVDVTGKPVRQRNVAMVYQQFINYPSMTVADNIASPLRLRREKNIDARVNELAARLRIEPFLKRLPAELSGGQQQRVALARALAKNAPLVLLDEPLVNLDYKLREGLRDELTQLFANGESTVVYATTEPSEALLLGGHTAVLDRGELLQYGPTSEVFQRPRSIRVAQAFSDPPINMIASSTFAQHRLRLPLFGEGRDGGFSRAQDSIGVLRGPHPNPPPEGEGVNRTPPPEGEGVNRTPPPEGEGAETIGIRANYLRVHPRPGDIAIAGRVELAEISGSDTFVHVATDIGDLVAQLTGVHQFTLGESITLYLSPTEVYVFDANGDMRVAPARRAR